MAAHNLFVGAPKVGKSFFMGQLAYHVAMGLPLWNYPVRKGTVLYLALEDDYARLQRRLSVMFGVECADNLFFATQAKTLHEGLDGELEGFIKEHKDAKLIIIDTFSGVCWGEHDLYYPDLGMPEGTHYDIGKYGLMRWEHLKNNCREKYLRLLLDGKLNEHLHEVDEECHARVELIVKQMKAGAGITEELKATEPMKWVGLMNNVRSAAEEIVLRELVYV